MHSYSLTGRSRRPCLHPTQQQHSTGSHSRQLLQRERNASKISSAIPARSNPQARQPTPEVDPEPANHTNYGSWRGGRGLGLEEGRRRSSRDDGFGEMQAVTEAEEWGLSAEQGGFWGVEVTRAGGANGGIYASYFRRNLDRDW
jgi:hypothetical protein